MRTSILMRNKGATTWGWSWWQVVLNLNVSSILASWFPIRHGSYHTQCFFVTAALNARNTFASLILPSLSTQNVTYTRPWIPFSRATGGCWYYVEGIRTGLILPPARGMKAFLLHCEHFSFIGICHKVFPVGKSTISFSEPSCVWVDTHIFHFFLWGGGSCASSSLQLWRSEFDCLLNRRRRNYRWRRRSCFINRGWFGECYNFRNGCFVREFYIRQNFHQFLVLLMTIITPITEYNNAINILRWYFWWTHRRHILYFVRQIPVPPARDSLHCPIQEFSFSQNYLVFLINSFRIWKIHDRISAYIAN